MNRLRRDTLLYFAYNARIAPDVLSEIAPGAEFEFIAHLPEWGLEFPIKDAHWKGGLPTVKRDETSTVWGAVFSVPNPEMKHLDKLEEEEQRLPSTVEAMDRNGRRHQVTTHLYSGNRGRRRNHKPSATYLELMLRGSRHWQLPAGWIAGLEEHIEPRS